MNNFFVILASGKSKRFNKKIAKQFYIYKNKEIIDHSIGKSLDSGLFKKIVIGTETGSRNHGIALRISSHLNIKNYS